MPWTFDHHGIQVVCSVNLCAILPIQPLQPSPLLKSIVKDPNLPCERGDWVITVFKDPDPAIGVYRNCRHKKYEIVETFSKIF